MKETYFTKMHPAIGFGFFMLAIGCSVLVQHPGYLTASVICALCLNITMTGRKAVRSFLTILPFWAILSAMNPLFNTLGAKILFTYFGRPYTLEALIYGMVTAGMFVAMLQWFSAYNAVMTEDKFTYLFGALAPSLSLLLTTVLRMIPNLMRKTRQIMDARKCIGMGAAESAGKKEKIMDGMITLSVLTSWALEGSVVTADSMNSRGYGTGKRSCYHSYQFKAADIAIASVFVVLCIIAAVFLFTGSGMATYTPVLEITSVTGGNLVGFLAYILFLMTPTILNLKEELQWHISRSKI